MQLDYSILPEVLLYALVFFIMYYLLYKPYIFSVIDPLFIFVFTTAFASVLVVNVVNDFRDVLHFFICQFCLYLGFLFVYKYFKQPLKESRHYIFKDILSLEYTVYVLFILYVIGNIIIFSTKGFALLSDAPSNSKVANFQNGFGIFRKINWAAGGFAIAGLLYLYLVKKRFVYMVLLLIVACFTSLEGSKGSLLRILTTFAFLAYHPLFRNRQEVSRVFRKYTPIGLFALMIVFFAVLIKENTNIEQAIFAFLRRFLYSADSVLYYYTPINENYFLRYNFSDYPPYILNTIFGFLRIAPYKEAFGNVMVENVFPDFAKADVIVGPNTPFYIEGKIFFGYYGAFLHSFVVGAIYGIMRNLYFALSSSSAFLFVFLCCICQVSGNIWTDTSLFVTILFDTCFFVIPTYILVCFVINKKLIIHKPSFVIS